MSKSKKRLARPKHAREILKHLPLGYEIRFPDIDPDGTTNHRRARGCKHPYLFDEKGEIVRHGDGRPFQIASTPSDRRNVIQTLASLRRAGVPVTE